MFPLNKIEYKKVLVVAGTYAEFNQFCNERLINAEEGNDNWNECEFVYFSFPDAMRGFRFDSYVLYGTWVKRNDFDYLTTIRCMDIDDKVQYFC